MARSDQFADRVAMVTGASSGIGRASALAFAEHGASVGVCDVNDEGGWRLSHSSREPAVERPT